MTHNHNHHAGKSIKFAFILNLSFTFVELIGGIWTNSLAIISDAVHDLGDSFALGQAWFFEHYAGKKGNRTFTYGYQRFSLLGALISAVILIAGSVFILSQAIPRVLNPQPVYVPGVVGFAVLGVLVNGIAVLRLKKDQGINARMVYLHLIEDVLGWLAVLVAGIIMVFKKVYYLDAALSILITVYIMFNVLKNIKKTADIFLQAAPENIRVDDIERSMSSIDRVCDVHHTHVWSMDGDNHVLTTHVVVDNQVSREDVLDIKEHIKNIVDNYQLSHSTVEIEYEGETCRIKNIGCCQ